METILVIEDDDDYRNMMRMALQQKGYETLEAADGASGIQIARLHRPDLIVTDIMMEKLDGYGVLSAVRKDPDLSSVPVIMITGWSSKGECGRAWQWAQMITWRNRSAQAN